LELDRTQRFPEGFLWGTALAAHQAEGGNDRNDWWAFEQEPGRIANGDRSGRGNDHYARFAEDFRLLRSLGTNAVRLSVEWSRIVPDEGQLDRRELDHYRAVLDAAADSGLEVFATAHHFTCPRWFARDGGFAVEEPAAVQRQLDRFRRYIEIIGRNLGDRLRFWNTVNEPAVFAQAGWLQGEFPPGVRGDLAAATRVLKHAVLAHGHAYQGLHEFSRNEVQVGLVKNLPRFTALREGHPGDEAVAAMQDEWFNGSVLRAVETGVWRDPTPGSEAGETNWPWLAGTTDFWGVNYYVTQFADSDHPLESQPARPGERQTQMGWGVHPEGLTHALRRVAAFGRPVYVTENGCATDDEAFRIEYLARHLAAVHAALEPGDGGAPKADVRGYFHWTGVDNFEWAQGWTPRFGLIAFDPETFERTVKEGGRFFAAVAAENALTPAQAERFLHR